MLRLLQVICLISAGALFLLLMQETAAAPNQNAPTSPPQTRPKDNPIPSTFVNLQVLPKDISKHDLVDLMKQFCITFSVRCSYCHQVSDDLTEGSFDSDEKPTKQKAR